MTKVSSAGGGNIRLAISVISLDVVSGGAQHKVRTARLDKSEVLIYDALDVSTSLFYITPNATCEH